MKIVHHWWLLLLLLIRVSTQASSNPFTQFNLGTYVACCWRYVFHLRLNKQTNYYYSFSIFLSLFLLVFQCNSFTNKKNTTPFFFLFSDKLRASVSFHQASHFSLFFLFSIPYHSFSSFFHFSQLFFHSIIFFQNIKK